ncbi:MAG: hypothetical protein NC548_22945 [Lachnospiraceae bacterium]|nr:hypothetical protein [Lachnospiraceae bacterium]
MNLQLLPTEELKELKDKIEETLAERRQKSLEEAWEQVRQAFVNYYEVSGDGIVLQDRTGAEIDIWLDQKRDFKC